MRQPFYRILLCCGVLPGYRSRQYSTWVSIRGTSVLDDGRC